jgi:AcrR family transcriptional regulator
MPKIVDHDKCREELLSRCFELFSRKGYNNVTIKEIIEELNVSTGMLYHYFPSKKVLFESLFKYKRVQDIDELSQEMGNANQNKIIEMFMDRWIENKKTYQDLMMLAIDFFRSNKCKPNQEVFVQFSNFYSSTISSYFGIPPQTGQFILIYLLGLYYHTLLVPGPVNFEEQLAILKKLVIDCSTQPQKRTQKNKTTR